jgi:hypothetical protein
VLAVILIPVALLALGGGAWRQRLLRAGCLVVAAALPIAGYLKDHEDSVGYGGFTGASYFDLYARVAPFAECSKFRPPAGTTRLCISIPRSQRLGPNAWEFTGISPAVQAFGEPDESPPQPGENGKLRSFAVAAIIGQPLDYLEAVGRDLVRIVDPSFASSVYAGNAGYGNTPEGLAKYYFDTSNLISVRRIVSEYYPTDGEVHKNVSFLTSYERGTRIEGPLIAVLLLLAFAAPIFTTGDNRRVSLLLLAATVVLFAAPVFVFEYDYRFAIPAFGPLAATAAIGAWAAVKRGLVLVAAKRSQASPGEVSHAGPNP